MGITGKGVSDPMYERREPSRLQPQFDYHDTNRYADSRIKDIAQEQSSVNGDLAAFARFVFGKQEAQ